MGCFVEVDVGLGFDCGDYVCRNGLVLCLSSVMSLGCMNV